MEIKNVLVKDIKYAPYNPRKISNEVLNKLKRSIEEFGYIEPIVVNKRTMHVVGGNQRLKVLRQLGIEEVQAVIVDLDDAHEKALNIALNKINGEWDLPALKDLLLEIDTGEIDTEITGFDMPEIEELMNQFHIEGEEDNFNVDEAVEEIEEPITKRGDIYLLGRHRLMCGDSTIKEDVEKLMDGKKADMVFTDPPYGVDYTGGTVVRERLCGDATPDLYLPSLKLIHATTIDKVAIYLWYSDSKSNAVSAAVSAAGFEQRCVIIWNKNNAQFGALGAQYHTKHEPALYLFKKGKSPNWYGPTNETTVWDCQRSNANKMHPTQKPVELAIRAINNSSKKGDLILDLFLGSGTTLIAAEQLGRTCYGMEISPQYCQVIIDRWEKLTGQKAEKVDA